MGVVVDSHVHVFADSLEKLIPKVSIGPLSKIITQDRVQDLRRQARDWLKPVSGSIHHVQTILRHLPDSARNQIDQLSGVLPLPSLLVESTPVDLEDAMRESQVDYAVLIAHPPHIPNDFVMEIAAKNPKILPVVNIPRGTAKPGQVLKKYVEKGAKALKIHAASDGEGPDSPRYRALVRTASDLGIPVIIHTGCLHCKLLYRDPSQGNAERFMKWYENYPQTQFILAHMNFHDPHTALDLCEEFPNLWVDTSWQPTEMIGEAVRRVGPNRVLFGSDWPLVGSNMLVGRKRIQDCIESGLLNEEQAKLILGENAVKLLGINIDAA
jgi:predicted TIM-barrel fold metal-dependent hydrolase